MATLNPPWSRVVNTTIRNFVKGSENNMMMNRKLLALLQKRGRISYNNSGRSYDWKVEYRLQSIIPYGDGDTITFSPQDRYKEAEIDWRGYNMPDMMRKLEYLQNRGNQAIIKYYSQITQLLLKNIREQFHLELYVDGYAAANSKRIHGIETLFSSTGTSTGSGLGALTPAVTYAGIDETPGNNGGSWTGTWPDGYGDPQYSFWSPLIIDVGDSVKWGGTDTKWVSNCIEALSGAIVWQSKIKSERGLVDVFMHEADLYRKFKGQMRTKERIIVERQADSSLLVALGFSDIINLDGVDNTMEFGVPAATSYGFAIDEMELLSMQDQLFVPEGPDWDIASKSWRFSIDFFGNLKWNPRAQIKLKNFTAAGT